MHIPSRCPTGRLGFPVSSTLCMTTSLSSLPLNLQKAELAPNVLAMVKASNRIAMLVPGEVLDEVTPQGRAKVIGIFIKVHMVAGYNLLGCEVKKGQSWLSSPTSNFFRGRKAAVIERGVELKGELSVKVCPAV